MEPGLYIICIPAGFRCYVLIGWLAYTAPDDKFSEEVAVYGGRILKQFGEGAPHLSQLAVEGPRSRTRLLDASRVEYFHRLNICRAIPADPEAWADACPRPADYPC